MIIILKIMKFFNLKKYVIQSTHFRKVSMNPLGTGFRSLGIHKSHFGNHWSLTHP
jgi:hypothetical protein